jgi:hypothetical protein
MTISEPAIDVVSALEALEISAWNLLVLFVIQMTTRPQNARMVAHENQKTDISLR